MTNLDENIINTHLNNMDYQHIIDTFTSNNEIKLSIIKKEEINKEEINKEKINKEEIFDEKNNNDSIDLNDDNFSEISFPYEYSDETFSTLSDSPVNIITPSEEQQELIDEIKNNSNIIVNAVAGAGKTTTILSAVRQLPDKRFILVTYNRELSTDVNNKIKSNEWGDINNNLRIEVKTYHAFSSKYNIPCKNDVELSNLIKSKASLGEDFISSILEHKIDYFVIDELQDMSFLLFEFIIKFITDITKTQKYKPSLILIGDEYQGVYEFRGAFKEFLTIEEAWTDLYLNFIHKNLKVSFRLPYSVAKYINKDILNEERIIPFKQNKEIKCYQYITKLFKFTDNISNTFIEIIGKLIKKWIEDEGAGYEDIFILCPSIKSNTSSLNIKQKNLSPVVQLQHYLSDSLKIDIYKNPNYKTKCPISTCQIYIPNNDSISIDSEEIKNKIAITTFHQSKGRERKYVIILGFDDSYFEFYNKNSPYDVCTSPLYVALTRSKEELHIFSNESRCEFKFIKSYSPEFITKIVHKNEKCKFLSQKSALENNLLTKKYSFLNDNVIKEILSNKITDINIKLNNKINSNKKINFERSVTDFIKFLPNEIEEIISKYIDKIFIKSIEPTNKINIKTHKKYLRGELEFKENISQFYGISLLAIYEQLINKKRCTILKFIEHELKSTDSNSFINKLKNTNKDTYDLILKFVKNVLYEFYKNNKEEITNYNVFFKLAIIYDIFTNYYDYKINQINHNLKYIDKKLFNKVVNNISKGIITNDIDNNINKDKKTDIENNDNKKLKHIFEHSIDISYKFCNTNFNIKGKLDLINLYGIYEFKCVEYISLEHKLQLIIYAYMWKNKYPEDDKTFRIINIKNGEAFDIKNDKKTDKYIKNIIKLISYQKSNLEINEKIDNDLFIENCKNIIKKYI